MTDPDPKALVRSEAFRRLVARHNRFAWGWTLLVLAAYLAFDLLSMLAPALMSVPIDRHGALTSGILVAFGICLLCVLVAVIGAYRRSEDRAP